MKKKIIIPIIVLFVIIITAFVSMWWSKASDYSSVLNANWDFSLPTGAKYSEVYRKNPSDSFHGDGIRYHVYTYKNEEYIEQMFNWNVVEKETIFSSSYSEAANEWLNELEVQNEHYPDYSKCVYWYQSQEDNSEVIIFWNKQNDMIYILESFL